MSQKGFYRARTKAQNTVYGPDVNTFVQHWSLSEVDLSSSLEEPERASRIPFKTRTWTKCDKIEPLILGDGSVVELQSIAVTSSAPVPEAGALTASDIRGAVGGEVIPGIASEAPKQESLSPPNTTTENSVEPEVKTDAEGDIIMD